MDDEILKDFTYIGINSSPRSEALPNFYGMKFLDFNLGLNIKTTLRNLSKIAPRLSEMKVTTKKVLIEYDGNFLLNALLFFKCFKKRTYIDCHNCAVEREEGKLPRYYVNLVYLLLLKKVFNARIIVHNQVMKDSYPIGSTVLTTPFPALDQFISDVKKNDVVFSCSLNSDEPVGSIIQTCRNLAQRGYKVKITGDFTDLDDETQAAGAPFFSGYISKQAYYELLAHSKVMVCLTTRIKTLLYSPREGISLGLKVIVSGSEVNRDFFGERAVYVDSLDDLAETVINAIE